MGRSPRWFAVISLILLLVLSFLPASVFAAPTLGTTSQSSVPPVGIKFPVASVSQKGVRLTPGGPKVSVTLGGPKVGLITGIQILLNQQVDQDVEASIQKPMGNTRVLFLQAKPRAVPGGRQVKVWTGAGNMPMILPTDLLSVTVVSSTAGSGSSTGSITTDIKKPESLLPSLEISSPKESQSLYLQSILKIEWGIKPGKGIHAPMVGGLKSPVNIYLTDGSNNVLRTIASGIVGMNIANFVTGRYAWVIPRDLPEGSYGIRVETTDKALSDRHAIIVRKDSDSDGDGVPDFLEKELAETFAPEVRLHPNDWTRLANVDWYLARVKMGFDHDRDSDCDIINLGEVSQGNIHQKKHKQKDWKRQHTGTQHFSNQKDHKFYLAHGNSSTQNGSSPQEWYVYVHVFPSKRIPGAYSIQYWFFYPYNDAFGAINHEADWEHITVTVDEQRKLRSIYFSQHEYGARYDNPQPGGPVTFVYTTHPVVYSAKGTHASYPKAGEFQINGALLDALRKMKVSNQKDSAADGGPVWQTWKSYVNVGEINSPLNGQEFIKYGGRWGKIGKLKYISGVTSGPQGPGVGKQPQWDDDSQE